MKKKRLVLVVAAALAVVLVAGGAYAATEWLTYGKNEGNTVTIGAAVSITPGATAYFDDVTLAEPGDETAATAVTVTSTSTEKAYDLVVETTFDMAAFDETDLYVKIADSEEGLASATAVKFENGLKIIDNATATKTVYVVIGLGAEADAGLAGAEITFSLAAQAHA